MAPARMLSYLRRLRWHLSPALLLVAIALFLFRLPLFRGYRFIGNSDRWNHHLSFAAFHSDNLARGTFSVWSEYLLTGFDTLAVPGNFFSPLFALPALLGTDDVVKVFGYVWLITLALTMLTTYAVLHSICGDRLAAVAGALTFSLSIFSLLKLSQNDNEFLPLFLAPVLFYLVHTARPENLFRRIAVLAGLVWICVYMSFLQPFAYISIFLLSYAAYRWLRGNRAPLLSLTLSFGLGTLLAAPRVFVQLEDIAQSTRSSGGGMEHVGPELFLRYLNGNIFGRSWREAYSAHTLNPSEGNLMFSSVFASLLLLLVMLRGRYTAVVDAERRKLVQYGFFVAFILSVILVIHVPPIHDLFAILFLRIPFLHSRFTAAALLPIALVSSLYLTRDPAWRLTPGRAFTVGLIASLVLLIGVANFDGVRNQIFGWLGLPLMVFIPVPGSQVASILASEGLRFVVLALIFVGLLAATRPLGSLDGGTFRTLLATVIIGQAALSADHFLSGPHTRSYSMPFEKYDSVLARPDEFLPPTPDQLRRLHEWLDNEHFRSIVVCPPEVIAVDCSTSVGMKWRIRLADGYLNSVSKRYMSLPWDEETRGGRSIRFFRLHSLSGWKGRERETVDPWKLLSLLNVRTALFVSPALYSNKGRQAPGGIVAHRNPSPYIYPRVYFASKVQPVTSSEATDAIRQHFSPCKTSTCTPLLQGKHPVDYVEGPVRGEFDDNGEIKWQFAGDRVRLDFPLSPQKRFLVINEAYNRRWEAYMAGRRLEVYATNVVLRGILVPEEATHVTMRFRSVLDDTLRYLAVTLPAGGMALLLLRKPLRGLLTRLVTPNANRNPPR